ncbi:Kazal-type serine protease inhibitor family protein [Thiolapillus sp.]|uniref:Kazal-type serine protease inhibitor family protein n=1 Tax=Thiolapillus sp. TaxID=2017437 RepID=UPI003AF7AB45
MGVATVSESHVLREVGNGCPEACHDLYHPVCGSDGLTYVNACILQLNACL